jgi:hypothetical protein
MNNKYFKWLVTRYPQNYIFRYPVRGALIITIFVFAFIMLYKPLGTRASGTLSYALTMAVYSLLSSFSVVLSVWLMKAFRKFSDQKNWMLYKELAADIYVLFVMGVTIYFLGFLVEAKGERWNILTFLDSVKSGFLLSFLPVAYFTGINYTYLFAPSTITKNAGPETDSDNPGEEPVQITSQLKKEELSFCPSELIYAESDGNYVDFYLCKDGLYLKETIRNSINSVEQQLSGSAWLFRTHRAFIVNLKKVRSRQGNTLGYLLKLDGTESRIPVSRKNTADFNRLLAKYCNP